MRAVGTCTFWRSRPARSLALNIYTAAAVLSLSRVTLHMLNEGDAIILISKWIFSSTDNSQRSCTRAAPPPLIPTKARFTRSTTVAEVLRASPAASNLMCIKTRPSIHARPSTALRSPATPAPSARTPERAVHASEHRPGSNLRACNARSIYVHGASTCL